MSINCCVVRGELSSAPELRVLASGTEIVALQITTRPDGGAALSVPVSLVDPPEWVVTLEVGDEVVAFGNVRRRFFRAGVTTASRVEIAASIVARASDKRAVKRIQRLSFAAAESITEPVAAVR